MIPGNDMFQSIGHDLNMGTIHNGMTAARSLIATERQLIEISVALIGQCNGFSDAELLLTRTASSPRLPATTLKVVREEILSGNDPLGEAFTRIRSAMQRRAMGAVYTPLLIVRSMLRWLAENGHPGRIVDPGAGSGRYILEAGKVFPKAKLVAVEMDPLAALTLRANLSVLGLTPRTTVLVSDYREIELDHCAGSTAFIGNPPYVRHHDIAENWKGWYSAQFARLGIKASALAGLHLHFFLKTRLLAQPGDVGSFVTSAEWMDVNYGDALRRLLMDELGVSALHVLEPTIQAFPGTATTAAITCFKVGAAATSLRVRSVKQLARLNGLSKGKEVPRSQFRETAKWSIIVRPPEHAGASGPELGELFRVHRGQVTGNNQVWIENAQAPSLPERVKFPTVTRAKDLLSAGMRLNFADSLRQVIDLPEDLSVLAPNERRAVDDFLTWAEEQGAHQGYVARHRKAWWAVRLKEPAPILCTYMARRAPQFTLNTCGARHINIAHGLYPRVPLEANFLERLVAWLNGHIPVESGRTYAGGLTKFEPREIERLRIPEPDTFVV